MAQTEHGHDKARKGSGGATVSYSFAELGHHVEKVVHDLTHRETLFDVFDLVHNQEEFRTAFAEATSAAHLDVVNGWLMEIADGPSRRVLSAAERVAMRLRVGTQGMMLGVNTSTQFIQLTGVGFGMTSPSGTLSRPSWWPMMPRAFSTVL